MRYRKIKRNIAPTKSTPLRAQPQFIHHGRCGIFLQMISTHRSSRPQKSHESDMNMSPFRPNIPTKITDFIVFSMGKLNKRSTPNDLLLGQLGSFGTSFGGDEFGRKYQFPRDGTRF